jgi:hypothetical protein
MFKLTNANSPWYVLPLSCIGKSLISTKSGVEVLNAETQQPEIDDKVQAEIYHYQFEVKVGY